MNSSDLHVAALVAAVAVICGIVVERILCKTISQYGKRHHVPQAHVQLMRLIVRWITVITVLIVVLSVFGIAIANLWITMSAIALGALIAFFAGWSLLANVLATLLVLIWRPFEIGDRIALHPDDISGEVKDTNLFYTQLVTPEGETVHVPNVFFFQKYIKVAARSERGSSASEKDTTT